LTKVVDQSQSSSESEGACQEQTLRVCPSPRTHDLQKSLWRRSDCQQPHRCQRQAYLDCESSQMALICITVRCSIEVSHAAGFRKSKSSSMKRKNRDNLGCCSLNCRSRVFISLILKGRWHSSCWAVDVATMRSGREHDLLTFLEVFPAIIAESFHTRIGLQSVVSIQRPC
jgi:hypothetical protein